MGNTSVEPSITKVGFFQSVSIVPWRARPPPKDMLTHANGKLVGDDESSPALARTTTRSPLPVQSKPSDPIKIHEEETKPAKPPPPSPPPQVEAKPLLNLTRLNRRSRPNRRPLFDPTTVS